MTIYIMLIFDILVPLFSVIPVNIQDIIDKDNWIRVWSTWCNKLKYIASHNFKPLGKRIEKLKVGNTVKFEWCRYKIIWKDIYPPWTKFNKFIKPWYTYLQTCVWNTKNVYIITLESISKPLY